MNLTDDLLRHAQAFEAGGENGVTAESTARVLRQAARTIKELDGNNGEDAQLQRGEVVSLKIICFLLIVGIFLLSFIIALLMVM